MHVIRICKYVKFNTVLCYKRRHMCKMSFDWIVKGAFLGLFRNLCCVMEERDRMLWSL